MLKNQRFSSLFRHYAKHHGLRKDDLAYYFTEELQNEDTPETVFLLVRAATRLETGKTQSETITEVAKHHYSRCAVHAPRRFKESVVCGWLGAESSTMLCACFSHFWLFCFFAKQTCRGIASPHAGIDGPKLLITPPLHDPLSRRGAAAVQESTALSG